MLFLCIYICIGNWATQDGPALMTQGYLVGHHHHHSWASWFEYQHWFNPSSLMVYGSSWLLTLFGPVEVEKIWAIIILCTTALGIFKVSKSSLSVWLFIPILLCQTMLKGFYNFHFSLDLVIWAWVFFQSKQFFMGTCLSLLAVLAHPLPVLFLTGLVFFLVLDRKMSIPALLGVVPAFISVLFWMMVQPGGQYTLRSFNHGLLEWATLDFLRVTDDQIWLAWAWAFTVIYIFIKHYHTKSILLFYAFLLFVAFWFQPEETMGGGLIGVRLQGFIALLVIVELKTWHPVALVGILAGIVLNIYTLFMIPDTPSFRKWSKMNKPFVTQYHGEPKDRVKWGLHWGEYITQQGKGICLSNHFLNSGYYPYKYVSHELRKGIATDTLIIKQEGRAFSLKLKEVTP